MGAMRGDLEWGTIAKLVRDAAARYGEREAVVEGRSRISYAELGERVERAAAACIAAGCRARRPGRGLGAQHRGLDRLGARRGDGGRGARAAEHALQGRGGGVRPRTQPREAAVRDRARSWAPPTSPRCAARRPRAAAPARCPRSRTWSRWWSSPTTHPATSAPGRTSWPAGRRCSGTEVTGARGRDRARCRLRHHLHLGHHRPPQGRGDHPRPDAARLCRSGRSSRACARATAT